MIDWTNESNLVSSNFNVKDCLYLPHWNRLADVHDGLDDEIKGNLIIFCTKMDDVMAFLGAKIMVHETYRPPAYNLLLTKVGASPTSAHMRGLAMDWHLAGYNNGMSCDEIRGRLIPKLEDFSMRMEDRPGSGWIHLDMKPVGPSGKRFFIP